MAHFQVIHSFNIESLEIWNSVTLCCIKRVILKIFWSFASKTLLFGLKLPPYTCQISTTRTHWEWMQYNVAIWEWESMKFINKHIYWIKFTVVILGNAFLDSCWSEPWLLTKSDVGGLGLWQSCRLIARRQNNGCRFEHLKYILTLSSYSYHIFSIRVCVLKCLLPGRMNFVECIDMDICRKRSSWNI